MEPSLMRRTLVVKPLTFRFLLVLSLLAALVLSLTAPAGAQGSAQQRQALQTQATVPGLQPIGRLPGSQRLDLAISLPLRNQEQLDALLQQLYDPTSPNYRRFLTVQEFTDQFGPTVVDQQQVIGFAESYGLKVTHTFADRLVVDVSGTVAEIEQAFQIKMYVYQHPTEKRTFYAPDIEPTVEAGLPVLSVDGLSTFSLPHSMLKRAAPSVTLKPGVHSDQTGSGPGGQFLGSDMREAYGGGTALNGSGQVVGLIELGPYRLSDVLSYFSTIGQTLNVPIVNVLIGVDGVCSNTEPPPGPCDDGEEAIDIQQAISMAPNLSALLVYEAYDSTSAISAYSQAASDNIAKQMSISFGWGGTPGSEPSYEQVFEELAAQGQSSFVASGDAGGNAGGGGYPGNSPNITDAGGTDITTVSAGGAWSSEVGWVGSGGGWNTASPIPSGSPNFLWNQTTAINSSNGGDPSYRNIPDVSAEANTDNYFCADGSCQGGIGGTSLAAPRWAAFVSLINQQAAGNASTSGNPTLGLLNPTIYTLSSGNYGDVFHDIVSGSDPSDSNPPLTCTIGSLGCLDVNGQGLQGFNAVTGFDLVTGWGSPNGPTAFTALFPATTNANFSMSASPSTLPLTAGNGGTSSIAVTALHGFSAATNLTVVVPGGQSNGPAGLTATLSADSIAAGGGPVTLTVSTTSSTPGGTYVIAIVGTSGSLTQTAYVTVELPAFVGVTATPGGVSLNQGATATVTATATVINGFNSPVTFAASGLPSGVTASFTSTNTTSTVTFTASSTAALTGANPVSVTITGTAAGAATQSTAINLFINPAVSGGAGTPVDLSSVFNIYSFYDNADESSITAAHSLDGVGYAYSANLLNSGADFDGTQFNFGPANQANAVYGTGPAITLPTGIYTTLQMLATGIEGNQASQPIVVTYADGSIGDFTQSFSDWCSALNGGGCVSTGSNPGESVAVAMPYRISAGGADNRVFYLYHYSFALNTNVGVASVTLPSNRDVVVLAMTLAGPVTTGFTLAAVPTSVSVAQGGNNTSTITVTPTGGFSGTVSLAASGLPNGVTAAFNPTTTSTTSTLTLAASSTAATGPATLTITGTSTSGNVTGTAMLPITITSPAGYSLRGGTPNPATISPGNSTQTSVTVTPANGYSGTVTLSCAITPAATPAPTCSLANNPVSVGNGVGGSATLTFTTVGPTAGSTAAVGRHLGPFYALLLPISGLALISAGFGSRGSRKKKFLGFLLLGIVLASLMVIPACGGNGSNSGGGGGGGNSGTPAGTYTITITGLDGNSNAQTGSPATVTVTVN
jgi:subtilase family serine protease